MEPQKNFQNSKEMSKDLVNYRRNLRESKRDELSRNFRGFPFKSKLYRLNKAQLFTLCRMLNTIGLKQNLPTNNNSITVAELKNRIQNCSLLNGFEIHNKTVNQILSKAINNYVKTQKPKYSGQYKNQFKNQGLGASMILSCLWRSESDARNKGKERNDRRIFSWRDL